MCRSLSGLCMGHAVQACPDAVGGEVNASSCLDPSGKLLHRFSAQILLLSAFCSGGERRRVGGERYKRPALVDLACRGRRTQRHSVPGRSIALSSDVGKQGLKAMPHARGVRVAPLRQLRRQSCGEVERAGEPKSAGALALAQRVSGEARERRREGGRDRGDACTRTGGVVEQTSVHLASQNLKRELNSRASIA